MIALKKSACELGLTQQELKDVLKTPERYAEFSTWFYGQTAALCDEHGIAIYPWDVMAFLEGLPVTD